MDKNIIQNLENSFDRLKEVKTKLLEIQSILLKVAAMRRAKERKNTSNIMLLSKIAESFQPLGVCPICGGAVLFRDGDGDKSYDLCTNNHEFPSSMTVISVETPVAN
ncbi:MAG: hypothetical protein H8E36_07050 [Rhodospirillaceae bacterium]|jgi:hypothetical protein|nr:hypothetical protein [Rhodospirillaceae bacterium]MBL6941204.1 hypothetical protein [Rhodospirillales bacterium]